MAIKKDVKKPAAAKDKPKGRTKDDESLKPDVLKKRANFVRFYIEQDFNDAAKAYTKAYGTTGNTAYSSASRLLKDDKIQQMFANEIAVILKEKRIPLEKRILDTWVARAFYDPTEIIDLDGRLTITTAELRKRGLQVCIDAINEKMTAQGDTYVEYKLADRDKALDMLQKYIQMVKPFDMKVDPDKNPESRSFTVNFVKS